MKRILVIIMVLVGCLTTQAHAQADAQCDYTLVFENIRIGGTEIDDGWFFSGFSEGGFFLDFCGVYTGETTDTFYAEITDREGNYFGSGYGTAIWTPSSYLHGTIRYSRGDFFLAGTGGLNDSSTFLLRYRSIRGVGYLAEMIPAAGKQSLSAGRHKFRRLDPARLEAVKGRRSPAAVEKRTLPGLRSNP